ncbi:hypothetical protein [Paraburkholderia pallida]|uniref:Uncharacterized protein n=1 Tax=Paraburkholderia pallida TaxID=2547399 RepID=A0A4P7D4C2_9BURK|nr:hypothetical protein [Paraburkholderia pallida]QBR03621.1 hypothetical protein E1956_41660 [Paraburkholderia pallida]
MSDPNPEDPRHLDGLEAIARCPGESIELEVADWLVAKGFARHQDLVRDSAFGGIAATEKGMMWLERLGRRV